MVNRKDFEKLGFKCEIYDQKGYNGVAFCAKDSLEEVRRGLGDEFWDEQKRILWGRVKGIHIINVYAPHGGLRGEDKHYYKLTWYKRFIAYLKAHTTSEESIMIVGDFNVARTDRDVYDPELLADSIGTMPEEREALEELLAWGLIDIFRSLYPDQQQFTWWDYIGGAIWRDQGMRIDYLLCTKSLVDKIKRVEVDLWPRRRRTPTPSDHAPLIGVFDI